MRIYSDQSRVNDKWALPDVEVFELTAREEKEGIMATMKSHTFREISDAMRTGKTRVWILDTGTAGDDDVLLGDTRDEVERDILHFHEIDMLPATWELREACDGIV